MHYIVKCVNVINERRRIILKKFIPPSNDLMFKNLFGTEENIMFTIDMLHKLLKLSYNELEELTIVNSVKLNKDMLDGFKLLNIVLCSNRK